MITMHLHRRACISYAKLTCNYICKQNEGITVVDFTYRNMDEHGKCLQDLCRVCGKRFSKTTRHPYECKAFSMQLQEAFGIEIDEDDGSIHPPSFCTSCFASMRHHEERMKTNSHYYSTLTPIQWLAHAEGNCATCSTHDSQFKGGRPSKKDKHRGRPPKSGMGLPLGSSALTHEVRLKMPRSNRPLDIPKLLPSQFLPPPPPLQLAQFTCSICEGILDSPIELGCGHTFCSECCISIFQSAARNPVCPEPHCTSTGPITVDAIKKPAALLVSSLASLQYKCSNGSCNATSPLQNLTVHSHQCTGNPVPMPCTPSQIPLRAVLDAPVDKTPSTVERRAMGHLTKRMMMSSSEYGTHGTITVPTGGQVCFIQCHRFCCHGKNVHLMITNSELAP